MLRRYEDLMLKIVRPPAEMGNPYLEILRAPGGAMVANNIPLALPLDPQLMAKITLLNTAGNDLVTFGRTCFEGLFEPTEVGPLYNQVLGQLAAHPDVGLRIALILLNLEAGDPRIAGHSLDHVPWEYLYDQARERFLALHSARISVARSSPKVAACSAIPPARPVRMLTVLANASVGARFCINIEDERTLIEKAVQQAGLNAVIGLPADPAAQAPGVDLVITHLDRVVAAQGQAHRASRAALRQFLDEPANRPHIIHFGCHGTYEDGPPYDGVLLLEQDLAPGDQQGLQDRLTARELRPLLADLAPHLRLVVFNACSTTANYNVAAFQGMAEATLAAGVPAAVAMQFDIPLDIAPAFACGFYTRLFGACLKEGHPIDLAVARAREEILRLQPQDRPHWGIPVLYRHPCGAEPFAMLADNRKAVRDLLARRDFVMGEHERLRERGRPYGAEPLPAWLAVRLDEAARELTEVEHALETLIAGG